MSNALLPALVGLTFPVEKTPQWSTKIQTATSGKETRLGFWSYPIWQYSVSYDILRSDNVNAELQQLLGFFNARRGLFDDWLFYDPDDYAATAQQFGTGDGSTTSFQLARSYGGYYEPVRATNTVTQVTADGSTVSPSNWSVNATTGVITFTSAPGAGVVLRWTGTFYWRCRFSEDQQTAEKFMAQFWRTKSLKFQSLK